jgi:MYXO-CTERM domain-containing protein
MLPAEIRMSQSRLIGITGLIAWLMVGVPAFIYHAGTPPSDPRWTAAFVLFGVLFAAALRRPRLLFLFAESAAAIALVLLRCDGYEGTLLARLTEREVEVVRLIAGGHSNKEIARALGTAEGTVKNHVSSILAKFGVRDRTRAVLKALEAGLLHRPDFGRT